MLELRNQDPGKYVSMQKVLSETKGQTNRKICRQTEILDNTGLLYILPDFAFEMQLIMFLHISIEILT